MMSLRIIMIIIMIKMCFVILGKIYAFISVVEGIGILLGSPIYTTIYNMTIHDFANCIFLFSSVLGTLVLVLYM